MEASDGEEEKSQKGSEEKEEVDSARRPARPQECGQETQGGETGREGCGETGSAETETAVRLPSVAVAPRGRTCPEPRSSLVVHALGAGCEWTAVGPEPCAPNRTADIQFKFISSVFPESVSGILRLSA